jgi:hypothetical protein
MSFSPKNAHLYLNAWPAVTCLIISSECVDAALEGLCSASLISGGLGALAVLETFDSILCHFPGAQQRLHTIGLDMILPSIVHSFSWSPLVSDAVLRVERRLDSRRNPLKGDSMDCTMYS